MPYSQASLAEVQHALHLPGGMALFNTCISYRRLLKQTGEVNQGPFVWEDVEPIHDPTEYPISVNVEVDDDGWAAIDIDYWTDSVIEAQARNVAATFLQVLCNIVKHADQPISQLDFVHDTSKEIIWAWNKNMPPMTVECVHRMVEKQVALRPNSPAIRGWDGDFTYQEMNTLANRLAEHLRSFGVGPEVLVPVCFDKSAWTVIAMLAVLKAGGGVVPLDAAHPANALEGKVLDAGAIIVVASEARASMFEMMVPYVVGVGAELMRSLDDVILEGDHTESSPEDAAFVMFTSGSTGKPKGVILCHQALVSSALAHGSALGLGPHTRFLQFAAHTFDNSLEEMFTNLIHGGCVCIPSEEDRLGDLPGAIQRLDANFMDLTPTVAALLRPEQVPSIRGMAVGGEALTQEVLNIWGGAIPVHNQYGPSECSINSTHRLHTDANGDVANIGTSVGSVSWVVDLRDHHRLVPIGCAGELLIEGPILARGYLEMPVETARVFVEMPRWASLDPHHAERGARRMYKTGDLVRYNSDGSLIYLGRKDTQVKLHGQRIELGEIEHHVKACLPETSQSSVELISIGQSQKALGAFICLAREDQSDEKIAILPMTAVFRTLAQTIADSISTRMAAYMVPSVFLPVTKMPLTSSGKLDRKRLRTTAQAQFEKLDKDDPNGITAYRLGAKNGSGRAPKTAMEKALQQLWSTVLKVDLEAIGADDSFFRHGGDSVGAMRLAATARQRGLILPVATIFQTPKLSDMAKNIAISESHGLAALNDDATDQDNAVHSLPEPTQPFSLITSKISHGMHALRQQVASLCRVSAEAVEDIYPCTPLQAGLVAASQRQPGAYVAVNAYELPAGTNLERFKQAWAKIVASESILRTRVVFVEDIGFLQVVVQSAISWTTVKDINNLPTTFRHLPPHDGGILSRYAIGEEDSDRPTFVWTAHHALYDGWSLPTLLGRVEHQYRHPEKPLAPVPSYSRFVEYLSSGDIAASDAFWTEALSGSAPQQFPQVPRPGYDVKATSQARRSVCFTRPRGTEVTMASLLRAAWAVVVSIYSSSDDVTFGEVLNGRDVPVDGIEDLVGPTLTSVPRRIRVDRSLSVQEVLLEVQRQLNRAIPHQFAGLQRIRTLSPTAAAACDFQNLLVIDTADEVAEGSLWSNLAGGGSKQGADFFSYPLNVTCTVGGSGGASHDINIELCAYFDAGILPEWQVVRMLGQFGTVLERMSATDNQARTIGDMELMGAEDTERVREWNQTPGPVVDRRVHDMVLESLARRGSGSTAVVGWDGILSNGDLDGLSAVLAKELSSKGVGRDGSRFVPFCLEKSVFAVVALLAILRTGAAFVPLDPAHPVERMREIARDCDAKLILCSPQFESTCLQVVDTIVPADLASVKKLLVATEGATAASHQEQLQDVSLPTDPAYVIFTSGTTGKPKGTIISHAAFCSGAAAHGPAMLMNPPFRFLQFASYTFDASMVEIFTTLIMGGSVAVPRGEDRTNGNIASVMEQMEVTMTLLTPSFARVLKPGDVPHLKTLILGGEAMTQSHIDTWADKVNLVNAYGPSECAVVATVNPCMHRAAVPSNLGRGIGRCWIVDPQNHDRLAPLGSVGELLIEGPTLSTGYLRNEAKTNEMFIANPRWAKQERLRFPDMPASSTRRMYKTGDLVRVCDDVSGEMLYMGRKDSSQAKLNGQRLELDEILHHLAAVDVVRHAVVAIPKTGPCAKRLVAVVSLRSTPKPVDSPTKFQMVTSRLACDAVKEAEDRLRQKLPSYMVPSTWVVLQEIPLLPSGKLDRTSVVRFVENMDDETLDTINRVLSSAADPDHPSVLTPDDVSVEEKLKSVWSQVLNITPDRVGRNVSFLHLGGDSITAMQVMARCRSLGLTVTVRDIISSKSVHDLALKVDTPRQQQQGQAIMGEDQHEFDPSPIQQLYFEQLISGNSPSAAPRNSHQFNQSVLLRLAKDATAQDLERGLQALVTTHSMLRARFRRGGTGHWRQRITTDVRGSYRFKTHAIGDQSRIEKRVQNSQKLLDIHNGPLMAADWFTVGKSGKDIFVFITIHHLVVDVVSWGIILQDLEDFLTTGKITAPASLPFQTWSRRQYEQAQSQKNGSALLPHHEPAAHGLEYWGMTGTSNVQADVVEGASVDLDTHTTDLLLGPDCHKTLQTELVDVLLAALLVSYRNATPDRQGAPTIYNEGHGRETGDDMVDLSRTVGWFTTLSPVHLPEESSLDGDIFNAIRWVKDYRRRLPEKGRPYFAYRMLTSEGRERYGHQWPVEVAFNYLGQMQQLNRPDNFLQSCDHLSVNSESDIGKDVPRLALIDVSAIVSRGHLRLSFSVNKHMKHQDAINTWAKNCLGLLQEAAERLMDRSPEQTLSAFSLLPLTYYGLESLNERLRSIEVHPSNIEDVYPCSPMQRGLLLSQLRDPEKYAYSAIFEVQSPATEVDPRRLHDAWQAVVQRHATLRTVFVDTVGDEGLMDQIVLREFPGRVHTMICKDAGEDTDKAIMSCLEQVQAIDYNEKKPSHRLTICNTAGGRTFCRLEISHAICDGSSIPILLDDLADAYDNEDASKSIKINKSAPLYRDYMAYIQSQPRADSVAYWKNYLDGVEPCLFPALSDGQSHPEPVLGSHIISFDRQVMGRVNTYCADSGITLSTLLQFVWAMAVRSYTGSDDVLFGYLASGRDLPVANIEHAVGAFINMLVCRVHISPDAEIGEALDTIKGDLADAMAHQSCSLAEMQHELRLAGSPLFNTAFTYQKRGRGQSSPSQAGLRYRVVSAEDPSEYVVAVNVEATDDKVEVHFSHWRNIVSDAQIRNVANTFQQILYDIVTDKEDDCTVGEIDLVGSFGLQQIWSWNNYELPCVERCVHDIISEHALSRPPNTPAVCGWDASFTFVELEAAASILARHLVEWGGVGTDSFVPLCFEKSAWTVVAQVAVLKAGGAFVNLDPSHPSSRLEQLIQDVGAQVVLCSPLHQKKMAKIVSKTLIVNVDTLATLSRNPATDKVFSSRAKPDNAAYVIFTSGTTGKPKGTVIDHGAFCTGALAHARAMFMHSGSRVLQFASYTFDASVMETLSCLLVGGCVCVPSDEARINDLAAVIRDMNITWTLLTPSVASTVKPESVPCLKTLVTGGEAMAAGHIERWGTQCALVNAYGPTECSVVATTSTKVDESHRVCNADRSSIGSAVGGRVWVVDPQNIHRLVPVGAIGELVVEGRLVARGYLNNKEQTDKAFIRSPPEWMNHPVFAGMDQTYPPGLTVGIYKTGDLVRCNSDGSISYVSRKDTQIKLNGRRIELGEIESNCLAGLPEDSQLAVDIVTPASSRAATKSLAVFFSCKVAAEMRDTSVGFRLLPMSEPLRQLAQALKSHLTAVIPAYMVPQLFVPVSGMPWTSAGKLDRRQLRRAIEEEVTRELLAGYRLSAAAATSKRRVPGSEVEKKLQGLWETVLGLPSGSVSLDDSFFGSGGDSLTAMRLVGAARAHKMVLSILDVFDKPTLADMALACGGMEHTTASVQQAIQPFDLVPCPKTELAILLDEVSSHCHVDREMIQDIYPCSPLQEGLVALANKQEGAYVAVNTLQLPLNLDMDRFKAAWQRVIDDTDLLRTRIVHTATSGFLQVVTTPRPVVWHQDDHLDEAELRGKAMGHQNGGELTRYSFVEHTHGRHFVWAIHHALYDGWSLPLVAQRVQETYHRIHVPEPAKASLPDDSHGQARYASFIRYLGQRDISASESFWTDFLDGASSVTHFPQLPASVATMNPATKKFRAETCKLRLGRAQVLADITIPTLIRAAWAIALGAYTGTEDVVFGETLSGRNIDLPGVMEMAGPTFTTIPTRVRLSRTTPVVQLLRDIQGLASRLAPHQHLGLQHIKKLNQDCAGACDFQNLLTIQSSSSSQQSIDSSDAPWDFQGGSSTEGFFTHPLVLECTVSDAGIQATIHSDEDVLSGWQTKRLVQQLEYVLQALASASKSSSTTLASIQVISPDDQALIARWNRINAQGDIERVVDSCIHGPFLREASAHPDRVGISAWDAELTYGEIKEYAVRLASRLRQLGVGPETMVPVCVERSAWAVVTLLAILMAGGAFVPLDPDHPAARHRDMLETVSPSLLVCSPGYSPRFQHLIKTCLSVDSSIIRSLPSGDMELLLENGAGPGNTAYVLFTSGSTGRPKGVAVAHRDFCSSSRGYARATHIEASSRVLHFASLTFDVALMEVLTPLTLGACVCVPTGEERLHNLGEAIVRLQATWAFLTPSVAHLLDPDLVCPTLKTLVCGGEAMLAETVERWADRLELMNGYGPTEASVLAVVNPRVSIERDSSIIGRATGAARAWVVDPRDDYNHQLAPVGAVGELAISGPLLARGYLNDPQKTANAFIENPAWGRDPAAGPLPATRIYRTGDLVRYRHDGALEFFGRRDGQVKVNGQRIELGEIESRLSVNNRVSLALVVQPKAGPCKRQLVGVLTLGGDVLSHPNTVDHQTWDAVSITQDCCPVVGPADRLAPIRTAITDIRSSLGDSLPHYMIPAVWIVLERMPVVVSGKLDRVKVGRWVESLDDAAYERISQDFGLAGGDEEEVEVTGPIKTLRDIWAKELNMPADRIKLNKAFLSLGGDSITAMGVVSRARIAKIRLSIQDVLRSKSLVHLVELAKFSHPGPSSNQAPKAESGDDRSFLLSPIQNLYMSSATKYSGDARFNQSFTVSVAPHVSFDTIKQAIHSIVARHSMLRVRFNKSTEGFWTQQVQKMQASTYCLVQHQVNSHRDIPIIVSTAQNSLDIERGPVFRADVFEAMAESETIISLIAHHLCVDMVSWRIIVQDLGQFLETGSLPQDEPFPFKDWCHLQAANHASLDQDTLLPFKEVPADPAYWGAHKAVTYGTTETRGFWLDEKTTKMALTDCHKTFRTEPSELFVAAIIHAFSKVFDDRATPTIYTENHGRDQAPGSQVDLTQTVGWFTSICPLVVPGGVDEVDTVRRTKDIRRSVPENGRSYFARKWLDLAANRDSSTPMEVLFNYLGGGVRNVDDADDSILKAVNLVADDEDLVADVGSETQRLALFEISAIIVNNKLQFSFVYDKGVGKLNDVRRWVDLCKHSLENMVASLVQQSPEPTLSDYPLLSPLTYGNLQKLTQAELPRLGIHCLSDVEDIYPCTPVQEGMLIGQLRDVNAYFFHGIYDVKHVDGRHQLDANKVLRGWQRVVDRHAALRTVFVESNRRGAVFDQVVLNRVDSGAVLLRSTDEDALNHLSQVTIHASAKLRKSRRQPQLPHQLTICTTPSGRLLVKLEINHAAVDGGSLAIILQELASAYSGSLELRPGPLFSNYVQYIRSLPAGADTEYWMTYLKGVRPCYFPRLIGDAIGESAKHRRLDSLRLPFDRFAELRHLSEQTRVTLANIMHTAWAFVLRKYTGSDDVCFGYLTADRDAPVDNIDRTVGTLINMLCCRIRITETQALESLFRTTQDQHLQSVSFQRCSLALVQHELGLAGKPLYNTSISTQNHGNGEDWGRGDGIRFEMETAHDPSEYAVTVNVDTSRNSEGVVFRYWTNHITTEQAEEMARTMASILDAFISQPAKSVTSLDLAITHRSTVKKMEPEEMSASRRSSSSADSFQTVPSQGPLSTSHKTTLLALWSALLNLPQDSIGGQDNFFELGGDSITAMKLVGEAKDHGLALTVADVFRNPCLDDMAASASAADVYASDESTANGADGLANMNMTSPQHQDAHEYERFSLLAASNIDAFLQTNIVPQTGVFRGGLSDVLPATDFQSLAVAGSLLTSRWMLNYFHLDGDGLVNLVRLKRACFRLVQSLDILRTVFVPSGGRFLQVVLRTVRPAFHVLEVENDHQLDTVTQEMQRRGGFEGELDVDGETSPRLGEQFVQFTVLRCRQSTRHRILLRISHAQYDGVCFPKILDALIAEYRGESVERPPSFANYLRASAGTLTSEHYQHWKKLLEGSSMTQVVNRMGPNYRRAAAGATACLKKVVHLPPVNHGRVTTATVVKAAWAYVLAQVSASTDVVFGHTVSGRNASVAGVESMIGPCLNLLPVRVKFGRSGRTARQVLDQVQEQQVANMPHEVLGFREIVRHCTSWPRWTYFTTTVQHQNVDQSTQVRLGDVDYRVGCAAGADEDFSDLSVFSQRAEGAGSDMYEMMLSFAQDGPVPREFAERALEMLCSTAEMFATHPETPLPSGTEIRGAAHQLPFSDTSVHGNNQDTFAASSLGHVKNSQLDNLSALVKNAWLQVLSLPSEDHNIDMDTSFFALGGDIVDLAQVALLLEQKGLPEPRLEDLIDHSTLRGHMAVLASLSGAASSTDGWTAAAEGHQVDRASILTVPSVHQDDNSMAKVVNIVRMAKKFMIKPKPKGQRVRAAV